MQRTFSPQVKWEKVRELVGHDVTRALDDVIHMNMHGNGQYLFWQMLRDRKQATVDFFHEEILEVDRDTEFEEDWKLIYSGNE